MDGLSRELTEREKKELRKFLLTPPRSIGSVLAQANALPNNCKVALEGHLFHDGSIQFSLLYALSNVADYFAALAEELNLN